MALRGQVRETHFWLQSQCTALSLIALFCAACVATAELPAGRALPTGVCLGFLALSLAGVVLGERRRHHLRSLVLGPGALHFRRRHILWSSLRSVTYTPPVAGLLKGAHRGGAVIVKNEGEDLVLPLWNYENADALLGEFRRRRPAVYRVDALEESLAGRFVGTLERATLPPINREDSNAHATGYRSTTTRHEPLPTRGSVLRTEATSRHVLVPVAGTAALGGAAMLAHAFHPLLVVTALMSSVFVAIVLTQSWSRACFRHHFTLFMGGAAVCRAEGLWVSENGRRRSRCLLEDGRDLRAGFHEHFEEVDAEGLTERTFVYQEELVAKTPPPPVARAWLVEVEPRIDAPPRCFRGAPWAKPVAYPLPAVIVLTPASEGYLLTRYTHDRAYAGDTFHETHAHAERQLAVELGIQAPEWVRLPLVSDSASDSVSDSDPAAAWSCWISPPTAGPTAV